MGGGMSTLFVLRRRAGISQDDLAAKLDVSQAAVSLMERGELSLSRHATTLEQLFGVPVSQLSLDYEEYLKDAGNASGDSEEDRSAATVGGSGDPGCDQS